MLTRLEGKPFICKGKDYIVKDQNLKIIDELTGRILEGKDLVTVFTKH